MLQRTYMIVLLKVNIKILKWKILSGMNVYVNVTHMTLFLKENIKNLEMFMWMLHMMTIVHRSQKVNIKKAWVVDEYLCERYTSLKELTREWIWKNIEWDECLCDCSISRSKY
jgi:hypothetical protein